MGRALTFDVCDDLKTLEGLSSAWDTLLGRSEAYRPFLSFAWFFHACRLGGLRPQVVTATEEGRLACLLPLAFDPRSKEAGSLLSFPLVDLADAMDILVEAKDSGVAADTLDFALQSFGSRSTMMFRDIRGDSYLLRAAVELQRRGIEFDCEIDVRLPIPYIDVSNGWNSYFLEEKNSNFRKVFKQSLEKMERQGIHLRHVDPSQVGLDDLVDRFLLLHFQGFRKTSHFASETAQALVRAVFPQAIAKGFFQAVVLTGKAGDTVGILLVAVGSKERVMAFQHGYDPSLRNSGPGRMMILSAVERACRDGAREFSLGRTSHDLKERLKTGEHKCFVLTLSR